MTTLDDLMGMGSKELHQVMLDGHPLQRAALADQQYLGVDLSLPGWARKLLWHTFRKTFHQDGEVLRGWNVKVEQTGIGPTTPRTNRRGQPITFGHYHVCDAPAFPRGWSGTDYLDYGVAGNTFFDLARLGATPLVAVNDGSMELLLGWEVFRIAGRMLPMSLYWALRHEGPLDALVPRPRPR